LSEFQLAIPIVLENEGGLSEDKDDPGGTTNFGISQRSYPALDIKNLTKEAATAIYLKDFWKFGGVNDQRVGTKLFDSYVNLKHLAMLYAQQILFQALTPDGIYGPETEDAVNRADSLTFLTAFRARLVKHYEDWAVAHPEEEKDLEGLKRRANQ
jgi:lysozyme family protein